LRLSFLSLFSFSCSRPCRDLPSFPTRRSSDLARDLLQLKQSLLQIPHIQEVLSNIEDPEVKKLNDAIFYPVHLVDLLESKSTKRSEEHTSELQSRFDLVCRLLLEKKKKSNSQA